MEGKNKVLITIDERNLVTAIGSDIFIIDINGWIVIDEGTGDKFAHAQSNYLKHDLFDYQCRNNYIYESGALRLLHESEKTMLFPQEEQVTFEEHMTDAYLDLDYRLSCMELGLI